MPSSGREVVSKSSSLAQSVQEEGYRIPRVRFLEPEADLLATVVQENLKCVVGVETRGDEEAADALRSWNLGRSTELHLRSLLPCTNISAWSGLARGHQRKRPLQGPVGTFAARC